MPSLGSDMEAGTLVKWRRAVGDRVARGDVLAEVETDKGIIEVETFTAGVIEREIVAPGAKVPVGTVLAELAVEGERTPTPSPSPSPSPTTPTPTPTTPTPPATPTPVRASPMAKKRAHDLGIDISTVPPSAKGVVSVADVEAAVALRATVPNAPKPIEAPPPLAPEKRMRRAIAATMSHAKRDIPHFYLRHTVDVSPCVGWLDGINATRDPERRIVIGALFVRAVAMAARAVPELNARWTGEEAPPIAEVHVGVAISLRNGGLVAPAIHHADTLGPDAIMQALVDATTRARAGTLRSSEMSDATLTLTSLGERGVDEVFPIIFPPQVAMVGMGVVRVRPWVEDGAVVARPLVDVTLAVDHRVTDGHRASRFLLALEKALRAPPEGS